MDLWSANAIDPLSLYKKLDFPDPVEATQSLILWQMLQKGQISPEMYLPSFAIESPQGQLPPTQGVGGPAVNTLNGADAPTPPPDAGTQSAEQIQSKQLLDAVPIR